MAYSKSVVTKKPMPARKAAAPAPRKVLPKKRTSRKGG